MNRDRYRTIFSKRLGMCVAVAETTKAQRKGSGRMPGSGSRVARSAALIVATSCALWSEAAFADPPLPTGGVVTNGTGTINQSGNTLTVNQSSQSLAANWQSFDIASGHAVVFNQPNSSSVALNRVIGTDASSIYGSLSANGKVFLVNPNGVLFAPGSEVSVGGLAASTLSISNEDFAAGRYRFTNGTGAGSIVNEGTIEAGSVVLIAPQVINNGTIRTPDGNTTLAAGDRVTVSMFDGLLTAEVDASVLNAEIQNHGQILADGGRVSMLAGRADTVLDSLINTDGVVRASSIRNENGKIYLDGGAGGTVYVDGTLDASGAETGAQGGSVTALGKNVGLMQNANVDASGDVGGGTVLIGGNWQGKGPEHNAEAVYMDLGATIRADANGQGDGGTVVLWSENYTGFYGDIAARGGASGGDGGKVETSSHENLQAMGGVDAAAPHGAAGEWLLDPLNVTITTITGNVSQAGGIFTPTSTPATIDAAAINSALNAGTAVTINTGNSGAEAGNITVASAISKTSGAGTSLTLDAAGAIAINAGINSTSGPLAVTLNANGGAISGTGALNTNGGLLAFNAASGTGTLSGLISGTGGVTKTGAGALTLSNQNTYSGGTTISAGTLTGSRGGANNTIITPFGSGTIAVAAGATAVVNNTSGSGFNYFNNEFTGAGTVSYLGSGVNRLMSAAGLSGFTGALSIDQNIVQLYGANTTATLNVSSGATFAVWSLHGNPIFGALTGGGTVAGVSGAGGGTFTVGNGGGSGTFSGVISNNYPISLVKVGSGTQALTNFNTLTGAVTVNGGTLSTLAPNGGIGALGRASSITINDGATVRVGGDNSLLGGPDSSTTVTINSGGTLLNDTGAAMHMSHVVLNGGTMSATVANGAWGNWLLNDGVSTGGSGATSTMSGGIAALTQAGGNAFNVQAGDTLNVSTALMGSAALIKQGTGTLVLSANNTYTSATTVSAGTLQVGAGGSTGTLGTGATAIDASATLRFFRSDSPAIGNALSGTGTMAFLGTGAINQSAYSLSGANTGFTGTVRIDDARLSYDNANDLGGAATIHVLSGGQVHATANIANAMNLNGAGWSETGGALGALHLGNGVTASGAINLQSDSRIMATGVGVNTGTIAGVISGPGALETGGNHATLALSAANTFTGALNVRHGVTDLNTASVLLAPTGSLATTAVNIGNASAVTPAANQRAVLQNQADNQLPNAVVSFDGNGNSSRWAIWQLLGTNQSAVGINDAAGGTLLENTDTQAGIGNGTLTLTGSGSYSFNGILRDKHAAGTSPGTLALIKNGTGTQALSGAGIFHSGPSTINGGTLALFNTSGYQSATTVNSGATLQLAGNTNVNHVAGFSLALNDGSTLDKTNTGYNTFNSANVAINGTVAFNITNNGVSNELFIGGGSTGLTGAGTINLTNSGSASTALTLRGQGNFSGAMNVSGGALNMGSGTALALQNTDVNLANGAQLNISGTPHATFGATDASLRSLTGSSSSGVVLGARTLTLGTSNGTGADFAGVISGTGALVKTGTGTQTLSGNNVYTGTTTISSGTLQVGNGGTAGTLGTGAVTDDASLVFNRSNLLTVANAIGGTGNVTQAGSGTTTLTANNTYTGSTTISAGVLNIGGSGSLGSGTYAGAISNNGVLQYSSSAAQTLSGAFTGTGSLLKGGTGMVTLSADNSYSGGTTISSGTLRTAYSNGAGTGTVTLGDSTTGSNDVAWLIAGGTNPSNSTIVSNNGTGTATLGSYSAGSYTEYLGTLQIHRDVTISDGTGDRTTVRGMISGTGNVAVTSGRVTFVNDGNTDTGVITINPGSTFQIDGALAARSNSAIVNNGTLWLVPGYYTTPVIQALNGTGTTSTIGGGPVNLNVGYGDASGNYAGVISNGGGIVSITKIGAGTQILSGNNIYGGTTAVSAGTLQVGENGATGRLGTGLVTNNADLIFRRSDTVSFSTLAAGGITGNGNLRALIGGGLTVDRAITQNGANSSILLEAGRNMAAGDASGGDVTLSSALGTSASGTITIFSGHATTAAYEANASGATGPTRYKTYGVAVTDTSGSVGGTRNYYYRETPSTLSVSGLTATRTYDGLLDATSALDGSGASIIGLLDGDALNYDDLIITGASFDDAHAGTRGLNVSFAGAAPGYTSAGATWAVSGYGSLSNYSNATAGTITPRAITTSIDAAGKTYDGLTGTTSTLNAPAGFVGNDGAIGIGGLLLAFDDPNAGTRNVVAGGAGSLNDFTGAARGNGSGIGAGNEVAGVASDYLVVTPASASAVIAQAPLTITVNDDAKLITQGDVAGYNGVSYSGFVHGENAADLTGSLSITRSNAGTEAAGTYDGVLAATGLTSGNYAINYASGSYRILPAQQLLIRVQNVDAVYGASPGGYVITSAQYIDGNGTTLRTLTPTAQNANTYTYSDGLGGSVTFTLAPQDAVTSSAGHLAVGHYSLAGTNTSITGGNFVGLNYVGNQAVSRIALTPSATGVSKVYDGNTGMTGMTLGLTGMLAGDGILLDATGTFDTRNAGSNRGYDISNIALSGTDAGNYYLTSGALSGNDGLITPKLLSASGITVDNKVYDGTTTATLTTGGYALNGLVSGDAVALDASGYSALFGNRNVGIGKTVTVGGLGLSGTDAGNYLLSQPMGMTANITPRPLMITATADTKYYDATTSTSAMPTVSGGLVGGDTFNLLAQRYATAEVGTGLTLTPIAAVSDGNGGLNYSLVFVDNTSGVIESRPVEVVQDVGSSTAGDLEELVAAAGRDGRLKTQGKRDEACIADDAQSCVVDQDALATLRVISTGIKLPQGVMTHPHDSNGDVKW